MEHLSGDSEELKLQMVDVAYRTARSKHLQSLVAYKPGHYMEALDQFGATKQMDDFFVIKTTKHD